MEASKPKFGIGDIVQLKYRAKADKGLFLQGKVVDVFNDVIGNHLYKVDFPDPYKICSEKEQWLEIVETVQQQKEKAIAEGKRLCGKMKFLPYEKVRLVQPIWLNDRGHTGIIKAIDASERTGGWAWKYLVHWGSMKGESWVEAEALESLQPEMVKASPTTKWAYKSWQGHQMMSVIELDKEGAEGWELIAFSEVKMPWVWLYYFKRPV